MSPFEQMLIDCGFKPTWQGPFVTYQVSYEAEPTAAFPLGGSDPLPELDEPDDLVCLPESAGHGGDELTITFS